MAGPYLIGLLLALGVFAYLVAVLLNPEDWT